MIVFNPVETRLIAWCHDPMPQQCTRALSSSTADTEFHICAADSKMLEHSHDGSVQVQAVCLISQCMADQARWEDGLKHCEAAMSVLPSATHMPLSLWKVGDLAH